MSVFTEIDKAAHERCPICLTQGMAINHDADKDEFYKSCECGYTKPLFGFLDESD